MSQLIRDLISPLNILSKSEILNVSKSFKTVQIKKDDYLVNAGKHLDSLVFLKKGILRSGLNQDQESDIFQSKDFTFEGNFLFSGGSILNYQPFPHSIYALIDSEILVLTLVELDGIYESIPGFVAVLRQLTQDELEKQEKLAVLIKIQPPQKRYEHFQRNFALLAAQLPESQLAHFLQIPTSELSRIRKKISLGSTF
jgi:CRP-like cAMP-binding protein